MDALEYLLKEIDTDVDNIKDDIASGVLTDHAEYRYSCGVLQGLFKAKLYINDLISKLEAN